jgi:hypothetical protein
MDKMNGSNIWPYVVVGSAIGGAIGYLFGTESGRRVRYSLGHPEQLADDVEGARERIQSKARMVTDRVHGLLNRAKYAIEEGQLAYRVAADEFQIRARQVQGKSNHIASDVHQTVDNVARAASSIEESVLDPICEMGALFRGIERGVRTILGKNAPAARTGSPNLEEPIPIYRSTHVVGE